MAKTKVTIKNLETATARSKLAVRKGPYWLKLRRGIYLGYRRNQDGMGSWSARDARGKLNRIALADDKELANGRTVLNYDQAQDVAKKFVQPDDAPRDNGHAVTLDEAITKYKALLAKSKGTPKKIERRKYNAEYPRVCLREHAPELLKKAVQLITADEIAGFRERLVHLKTSSIDRLMKGLWRAIRIAGIADARINASALRDGVQPLEDDGTTEFRDMLKPHEVKMIVAGAYERDPALGLLVEVLAQTGTRSSQAARLVISDLQDANPSQPFLRMPRSGKGKSENAAAKRAQYFRVDIGVELGRKLRAAAADRPSKAPLLLQHDQTSWGDEPSGLYRRPMRKIIAAAGRDPDVVTMYWLRHTSISARLLKNQNIRIVAAIHDTSIGEIERRYSCHITDHASEITRAFLDEQFAASNVIQMRKPSTKPSTTPNPEGAIKHAR